MTFGSREKRKKTICEKDFQISDSKNQRHFLVLSQLFRGLNIVYAINLSNGIFNIWEKPKYSN
jgi:hypothetical protein